MNPITATTPTPTEGVPLPPERRPYQAPTVVYEAPLEVRAGSPLALPDPLDLTN
jgi:hypothetical protein